jgi:hypothetical protein
MHFQNYEEVEESNEEMLLEPEREVTWPEAMEGFDMLRSYLQANGQHKLVEMLGAVEDHLHAEREKMLTQKTITDYFKHT